MTAVAATVGSRGTKTSEWPSLMADTAARAAGEVTAVTSVGAELGSREFVARARSVDMEACSSVFAFSSASLAALCSFSRSSKDFMRPWTARRRPRA